MIRRAVAACALVLTVLIDAGPDLRAQATYIMPAEPEVGFSHYREYAPNDEVLDVAEILSVDESVSVPAGDFDDVLKVNVIDVPEPEEFEHVYFAPGIGRVFIEADFDDAGVPLNTISLDSVTVIPLPPALVPGIAGLALTVGFTGWRRLRRMRG